MTDQSDDAPNETLPASIASFDDFQAIDYIPPDPLKRRELDLALSNQFVWWVRDRLDPADLKAFDSVNSTLASDASLKVTSVLDEIISKLPAASSLRINVARDEIILGQARTIGAKVLLCSEALQRIWQWEREPGGARLYERLGHELGLRIKVIRREKKAPLDPRMRAFKDDVKKEYSLLQKMLRSRDSGRRPLPFDDLLSLAEDQIKANPRSFPRLLSNLKAFRELVQRDNEWLTQRSTTPAMFALELLALGTNRSTESLRQELSRISSRKL